MPRARSRDGPVRSYRAGARVSTHLTPPRPSSLARLREQLEFSSRSLVFPSDGERVLRAWGPPERPFALAVEPAGARWRVHGWGVDAAGARAAAVALFSLDHDLAAFYRLVRREPVLRGSERRFRGLRLPRDASTYEALLHAILGQQLSVAAAHAIKRRLFDRLDASLEVEGFEIPRVPTPSELLGLDEAGLKSVGASGAKARALLALARARRDGALDDAAIAALPDVAAVDRLDALEGVGRWTAENALLRAGGRTGLFVAGDLGLRAALDRFGAVPRGAPEAAARAWADRWYPGWGSYATLYLWRKLVAEATARGEA